MSGWSADIDAWQQKRDARPQSYYLKALLDFLVFWMDDRMWQWRGFPKRQIYRLTWNLYRKVRWPDDRFEPMPPVPW